MTSLMIYGTTSSAGKSLIATGLCRIFSNKGYKTTPFKSQNMSRYYYTLENGKKPLILLDFFAERCYNISA